MQIWKVSHARRIGGPYDTATLRRSIESGKLPRNAFVQADGESADWQQIWTVEALVDNPRQGAPKYCLECDSRAVIAAGDTNESVRCPECFTTGPFVDFLDDNAVQIIGVPPEPWGNHDFIATAFAGVLLLVAIAGAFALIFNPLLSTLLGFVQLACGAGLFAATFQHRSESSKYRSHLKNVESSLQKRTELLVSTDRELHALRRNLVKVRDDLITKTEADCLQTRQEIVVELALAKDQHNAVHRMAERFLMETRKWWTTKLTGQNYQLTKERISKAIEFCRKQGYRVSAEHQREILGQLKADYEIVLAKEHEKAEQNRIREQMRDEQRAQREFQREIERTEREAKRQETEREVIQRALDEAMLKVGAEHSAEVQRLQQSLQAAEERVLAAQEMAQRSKSQAELTRVGHVYVISNVGSFGEDGFKIGLTRRLDPLDRVRELGDASVPFPFDVHMMIHSQDAPNLERKLHQALHRYRINRVNFRKEFFRIDLETIRTVVEEHHGKVEYTYRPDNDESEYLQSLKISDADFAYLTRVADASKFEDEDDDLDGAEEP